MTLYGGFVRIIAPIVRLVVRVEPRCPPLCPTLLVRLHLFFGVAAHGLVHLDVTGDAQQLAVVRVVCQSLHLLHRSPCLHRLDVMHVHAWGDEAFGLAYLAQAVGTSEHLGS